MLLFFSFTKKWQRFTLRQTTKPLKFQLLKTTKVAFSLTLNSPSPGGCNTILHYPSKTKISRANTLEHCWLPWQRGKEFWKVLHQQLNTVFIIQGKNESCISSQSQGGWEMQFYHEPERQQKIFGTSTTIHSSKPWLNCCLYTNVKISRRDAPVSLYPHCQPTTNMPHLDDIIDISSFTFLTNFLYFFSWSLAPLSIHYLK